jgi:hypothetical protein
MMSCPSDDYCKNGHLRRPLPTPESRNECLDCKAARAKKYAARHAKPWTADRKQVTENAPDEVVRAQRVLHLMDEKWRASTVWERQEKQDEIDALTNKAAHGD